MKSLSLLLLVCFFSLSVSAEPESDVQIEAKDIAGKYVVLNVVENLLDISENGTFSVTKQASWLEPVLCSGNYVIADAVWTGVGECEDGAYITLEVNVEESSPERFLSLDQAQVLPIRTSVHVNFPWFGMVNPRWLKKAPILRVRSFEGLDYEQALILLNRAQVQGAFSEFEL